MTERGTHGIAAELLHIRELLKRERVDDAIAQCRVMLSQFPDNREAHGFLGLAYLRQDKLTEADRHLSHAMRSAPDEPALLNAVGIIRLKQDRHEEAVRLFCHSLKVCPVGSDALSYLAKAFTMRQQPAQATAYLERLVRVLPDSAEAHRRASDNHLTLGDVEQAIRYARKAIRLAPDDVPARMSLADALEAGGRFKQAKFQYLAVLEQAPAEAPALSGLLSLKGTPIPGQYISIAEQLLSGSGLQDPDRVQLHLALAQYLDQQGQYAEAFAHLRAGNAVRFRNHKFDSAAHSRAVDRVIEAFSGATLAAASSPAARTKKPIFIVGMPRSGTTLVEQILASHSQVAAGGELSEIIVIAGQIRSCGVTYPEAMRKMDRDTVAPLASRYLEKLESISPGAVRVTDKMPFNFMHLGLIAALFPDATIIHCRRNPLDTCLSCYFTTFNEQLQFASDLEALGKYWLDYQRLMNHWRNVLPRRIFEVDYERLVSHTEKSVKEILKFCELAWEPACLNFYQTDRGVRTPSRWQVRQPIYRQSVGRWRNYESHLQPLRDVLSPVLHDDASDASGSSAAAIILMGASGSGKSTLARRLGDRLRAIVLEGDDYHPQGNIEKMSGGAPLDDDDRWPWLDRLAVVISNSEHLDRPVICACSALKRSYRDRLRAQVKRRLWFVYLRATIDVLAQRLALRPGHFMPPSLLSSQLDDLEEPQSDEHAIVIASEGDPDELVRSVLQQLPLSTSPGDGGQRM